MENVLAILAALGGFEFVKWIVRLITNRRNNKIIDDTQAEREKYQTLESHIEFLQNELKEKEARFVDKELRFVEQTERLRKAQDENFRMREEITDLKVELAKLEQWKCEVRKCANRQPPNGM